jgi:hypothetical protein
MYRLVSKAFKFFLIMAILVVLFVAMLISPRISHDVDVFIDLAERVVVFIIIVMLGIWAEMIRSKSASKAEERRREEWNAFEYWLYDRANDQWIPANGPDSGRSWWSNDWKRWLTDDEIAAKIPFRKSFKTRLHVCDLNNQSNGAWRDECEVWTYYPARDHWEALDWTKTDNSFMLF